MVADWQNVTVPVDRWNVTVVMVKVELFALLAMDMDMTKMTIAAPIVN